ncbi:MAG: ACP S-malonyltransferase [Calditrichaeota bacterium]|nr:ACP S-malonyltransferase [Calditrichota bacterium]MCB9368308.1 ACP S-malonyltransferase [Calditrichota bacterium]
MARDLFDKFDLVKQRFTQANDILGFDLAQFCFEGPEDDLRQTRVTQPALYVHSVIVGELLAEQGVTPQAAAGHSLGEYSALACAAAFTFETGLELVKVRANAMQEAGTEKPGTMAAIVGLDFDKVEEICKNTTEGVVVPANYNSPGQLVISGDIPGVDAAMAACKSAGAKLVRKLVVSGAFHSPLMSSAAERLQAALDKADITSPKVPVLSNVTGKPHGDAANIRKNLYDQLLSPVRWTECLETLNSMSPNRWFELGPGNVLAGLLKRTINGASAQTVGTAAELETVLQGASV